MYTARWRHTQVLDPSLHSLGNRAIHFDPKIQVLCSTHGGHTYVVEMQKFRIASHFSRWIYDGAQELSAIGDRLRTTSPQKDYTIL